MHLPLIFPILNPPVSLGRLASNLISPAVRTVPFSLSSFLCVFFFQKEIAFCHIYLYKKVFKVQKKRSKNVLFLATFLTKKKYSSSLPAFNWFYHTKVRMCSTCSLQQIFRTVRVPKQTGTVSIFFGQQQRLPGIEQTGGVFIGRSVLPSNNNRHVSVNYAMGTVFL